MLVLRTLGQLGLFTPTGNPVGGRRRVLALLAWLLRQRGASAAREQIANLFWPDHEPAAARHSLRQSLTELRAVLPEGGLQVGSDRLTVNPAVLALDVTQFERLIAARDWQGALASYGGRFLEGADEVGGEEWRTWLDAERAGLHRQVGAAFEAAVEAETAQASWEAAIAWAERWTSLEPDDERAATALIRVLVQAGRREAAQGRHAAFKTRLVADEADPSAEFSRLGRLLEAVAQETPQARGLLTPDLVGRRRQFALLSETWAVVRSGAGRLVVIEGDEGSGKTRLAEEFARSLRDQAASAVVVAGRAFAAESALPLRALATLLEALSTAPGLPAADREDLAALASVAPALGHRFPGVGPGGAAPLIDALPRALGAVTNDMPLLLILDDADLADEASLQTLAALVRRSPPRLMVLVTTRPDGLRQGAFRDAVADSAGGTIRIGLAPLDRSEAIEMVASMAPIAPEAVRAIADAAVGDLGGIPGHTRGLVAQLADAGTLRPDARGVWDLVAPLARPVGLPAPVRAAVADRLRGLAPPVRLLLELSAAAGVRVEQQSLELASRETPELFQDQLGELLLRRLLRRSPGDGGTFEFPNEAERRAIWDALSPGRRAELERRLRESARPARRWRGRQMAVSAGLLLLATLVVVRVAWETPAAEAGSTLLLADVRNETGDPVLDRALTLVATVELNESRRFQLLPRTRVREALARMGRPGADSVLDETLAREVAERENLPLVLAIDASRVEGRYLLAARLLAPATGEVVRALAQRVESRDELLAGMERLLVDVRRALGEVRLRDVGDDDGLPRVSTTSLEALRAYADGQVAWAAREYASAKAAWSRAVALDTSFALAYASLADEEFRTNDVPEGERLLRRAMSLAGRLTPREQLLLEASSARRLGTSAAAIEAARRLAERYPDRSSWYNLGTQYLQARRCAEALGAFGRSLEFDTLFTNTYINVATCHQLLRQFGSAVTAYERAAQVDSTALRLGNVGEEYGAALLMNGEPDRAERHFGQMTEWGPDWNRGRGHRQLAWRRMAEGRFAEAIREADRAIESNRNTPSLQSLYRDQLVKARALLGRGDTTAARLLLRTTWRTRPDTLLEPLFLEWAAEVAWRAGLASLLPEIRERLLGRIRPGVPQHGRIKAAILGIEALAASRPEDAIRHTEAVWPPAEGARWTMDWVVRAEALERAGQPDSSLALWLEMAESPWVGMELQDTWTRADLTVARVLMRLGRPAEALVAVNRFLDRWSRADAEAPELQEARRLRQELLRGAAR